VEALRLPARGVGTRTLRAFLTRAGSRHMCQRQGRPRTVITVFAPVHFFLAAAAASAAFLCSTAISCKLWATATNRSPFLAR
jgi:hypothetical protein